MALSCTMIHSETRSGKHAEQSFQIFQILSIYSIYFLNLIIFVLIWMNVNFVFTSTHLPSSLQTISSRSQNDSHVMEIMTTVGQDLRRIAEQIERSPERGIIRRRADDVS